MISDVQFLFLTFSFICFIRVSADKRHWGDSVPLAQKKKGVFNPPYVQASAKDIEMTSYALLAYAKQKKINEALPIVKWIISQRNPTGGFASTQVQHFIYYYI